MDEQSREYRDRFGTDCAWRTWTAAQFAAYAACALGLAVSLWIAPKATWVAFSYGLAFFFFVSLALRIAVVAVGGLSDPSIRIARRQVESLRDADLPVYSVLVPLAHEPKVVPDLVAALDAMDYPRDRLDVQFLLEPDDRETRSALGAVPLPGHMRITLSPGGFPRTKPRACNVGLRRAAGEFLVVYDAEDRPERDQLKKAVAAYRTAPGEVVCLQCRLAHYNSRQSLFARWAALEYLVWFRWVLPGLQRIGAAMPLGGTSNHFRTRALRDLGGWDPFNVTEDCDLGMRIARAGRRVCMLDSTTWEEAVARPRAWIRQRSRWFKGYWQTWLVHMRWPAVREFGWRRSAYFVLLIFGNILTQALSPGLWLIMGVWLMAGWSVADPSSAISLMAMDLAIMALYANAGLMLLNLVACLAGRRPDLVPAAILSPIEWLLLSVAAWHGLVQFARQPFHWEKTGHGDAVAEDASSGHSRARHAVAMALTVAFAVVLGAGAYAVSLRLRAELTRRREAKTEPAPLLFDASDYARAVDLTGAERGDRAWRLRPVSRGGVASRFEAAPNERNVGRARLRLPGGLDLACWPECDLTGFKALVFTAWLPADAPEGVRVMAHLRDREDLWYQALAAQVLMPGRWATVELDLRPESGRWARRGHGKPWDAYSAQRVREFGLRFFGQAAYRGDLRIGALRAIPWSGPERAARGELRIAMRGSVPASIARGRRVELACSLSKTYANVFDPNEIDAQGVVTTPDGGEERVPCFFHQGYTRRLTANREVLIPEGDGTWRMRYTPVRAGRHVLRIEARDRDGAAAASTPLCLDVTPAPFRGFVRVSEKDRRFLAFDDGTFFYPVGHNICQPVDQEPPFPYECPPPVDEGTFTYDRFLAKMAANGENCGRLWLAPWSFGIEGNPRWPNFHGVGRYNLANAWRLDHVLERAEQMGIYLHLTMDHKSQFAKRGVNEANPYYWACGGILTDNLQYFTDLDAVAAYRNRLRYIVARWGYSPNVLAWELWGEVNLVPGFDPAVVAGWHGQMGRYLRAIDPRRHLVFTHCHNWQQGHDLWALPEIDCVQGNGYIRPPNRSTDHTVNFAGYVAEEAAFGKPIFVAEFGGRSELGAPSADYLEAQLHSGLWASLMQPLAGTAMHWWWNFIDGYDLYFHFKPYAEFARRVDRLQRSYRTISPEVRADAPGLKASGLHGGDRAVAWVHHERVFEMWRNVPVVPGAVLRLDGLDPGVYRVECIDTVTGRTVCSGDVAAEDGTLEASLPPVQRDLAVAIDLQDAVSGD